MRWIGDENSINRQVTNVKFKKHSSSSPEVKACFTFPCIRVTWTFASYLRKKKKKIDSKLSVSSIHAESETGLVSRSSRWIACRFIAGDAPRLFCFANIAPFSVRVTRCFLFRYNRGQTKKRGRTNRTRCLAGIRPAGSYQIVARDSSRGLHTGERVITPLGSRA